MFLPEEDRYSHSRRSVESQICSLFGGRIAEELISGPDGVTTGASNDIDRATQLARNMVTKWGLSERMGPLKYDDDEGEVFLGMSAGSQSKSISSQTAREIDEEIKKIIDGCYKRAKEILEENIEKLHVMADALMEYETLSPAQAEDIMAGAKPRAPDDGANTSKTDDEKDSQPGSVGDPLEET